MDKTFQDMAKNGKNSVDNIVSWMQEAKVVDKTKEAEDNAKKMFSQVKNKADVTEAEFKKVLAAVAEQQKKTIDQVSKMLQEEGPKILDALSAAATAASAAASAVSGAASKIQDAFK